MSEGLYTHRTRNAGEIVTDVLYNGAHQNQLQNDIPNQCGALSDDLAAFQATQDPAPGGVVNQVDSILEEFQQLRFALADIKTQLNGGTPLAEWYVPVDVDSAVQLGKGARIFRSTTQSISFKTQTAVVFDTVRYDTGATDPGTDPFFVIGTPTRLRARVAGLYQFNGFVLLASGGSGAVSAFIRLNGTKLLCATEWVSDGSQTPKLAVSAQFLCAQDDYVELMIFQVASNPQTLFTAEFGLELLNPTAVIPPPDIWTLQITESGTGTGVVTSDVGPINCPGVCSASYADGTLVTLTATPTVGGFVEWSGDLPVSPDPTNPIVVTMDQARTINALFTAYTLQITDSGTGSGIVTSDIGAINCPGVCSDQYAPGDIVSLTATPTAGAFVQWSGDIDPGEEFNNPGLVTMDADKTVDVEFALTGVLLSFPSGGSANLLNTVYIAPTSLMAVSATIGAVQFKTTIDITITALSVTMAAALAGGHTVDFNLNIGGVDDGTIVINLTAGGIGGAATGAIVVPADTLITIRAVQSGGGGDNIQSLSVVYEPAV